MNRWLSTVLAGGCALAQATLLFVLHPLVLFEAGGGASRPADADVRVLGLSFDGFMVKDTGHLGGWVPQLVFVVLSAVLMYTVLRAAPDARPRIRTVLELFGAMLFAAGIAELLSLAMDPARRPSGLTYTDWFVYLQLKQEWAAPVQFALLTGWVVLPPWAAMWLLRRLPTVRELVGETADGCGGSTEPEPVPVLAAAREHRDAIFAGLIPVVLLAVAGGPVLRHTNVRQLKQASITFDPDLWLPYHPPALVDEWSGVLYPALRMRPLKTENIGGWLGTLVICVVLLAVLAAALRAVAARMAGKRPLRLLMECWCATLLAAMVAAVVEICLLNGVAPRITPGLAHPFDAASADAVRFGTVWGWATGVAFLGAVLVRGRRQHPTESSVGEGQLSHVE
ncbi:hypothetical protein [Kitasatospora sp. MAP5-34]|uniref:hypothetical protein n=1 Tax=Kitasatospora sp. MAP5-34 TaxID=3035102 RepID=UPI00247449AA|nr:hypothetical protein [Kitasatospora sp. MAP5-34]MDH6577032.1 hypothetical protein [Kitasatospora sp. MAP5-34]